MKPMIELYNSSNAMVTSFEATEETVPLQIAQHVLKYKQKIVWAAYRSGIHVSLYLVDVQDSALSVQPARMMPYG